MLTSRQAVLCTLEHEEPGCVPVFFGTSGATTMLAPADSRLKAHLGIESSDKLLSELLRAYTVEDDQLKFIVNTVRKSILETVAQLPAG